MFFLPRRTGRSGVCATLLNIARAPVPEGLAPAMVHRRRPFGTAPVQQRETQNTPMFQSNLHDPTARAQWRGPVPGCGQAKGGNGAQHSTEAAKSQRLARAWRSATTPAYSLIPAHAGTHGPHARPWRGQMLKGGGRQGEADRWPTTDSHQMSACPAAPPLRPPLVGEPPPPGRGTSPISMVTTS